MCFYGTCDAAANFQKEVTQFMKMNGFTIGKYNVCTIVRKERSIRTLVHGNDLFPTGSREQMERFKKKLEGRFEIKTKVIGSGEEESQEEKVLNKIIRWTASGWEYEGDRRHEEIVVRTLDLQDSNPVRSPGEEERP